MRALTPASCGGCAGSAVSSDPAPLATVRVRAPELTSARLHLRSLEDGDVEAMHRLWTDADVRRFLWDDVVIPREQTAAVIAASSDDFVRHGYGLWGVCLNSTGEFVGFCGFRASETGEPELLYALAPAYWGCGLATEAAATVLTCGFSQLGFTRVVAATDTPNWASVRVIQRLGMAFERRGWLNGLDTLFYSLSHQEFRARSGG